MAGRPRIAENYQGDRKGTPVPYTKWLYKGPRVWYGRTLAVALPAAVAIALALQLLCNLFS
ncbi:MAG: hypothetical protein E6I93_11225, partial [Chloroflexi bacterium]